MKSAYRIQRIIVVIYCLFSMALVPAGAQVELGAVQWSRDLEQAQVQARASSKPLFILFQEVPGCRTCRDYGKNVLSHPLLVEALETLFVPVAIYNNGRGKDQEALTLFGEPAWNNPVVRITDAETRALTPRLTGTYDVAGVSHAMVKALRKVGKRVPGYLQVLHEEASSYKRGVERATFAMACFWSGEAHLGRKSGVVATSPGFIGRHEVVEVLFDPARVSFAELLAHAASGSCDRHVFAEDPRQRSEAGEVMGSRVSMRRGSMRPDQEPKYQMAQTYWRFVPMTELQQVRVNSSVGSRVDPGRWLSPRQRALWETVRTHPRENWESMIGRSDLADAWLEVQHRAASAADGRASVLTIEHSR